MSLDSWGQGGTRFRPHWHIHEICWFVEFIFDSGSGPWICNQVFVYFTFESNQFFFARRSAPNLPRKKPANANTQATKHNLSLYVTDETCFWVPCSAHLAPKDRIRKIYILLRTRRFGSVCKYLVASILQQRNDYHREARHRHLLPLIAFN